MAKSSDKYQVRKPKRNKRDFVDLVRSVPRDVFVRMVSKSGLPTDEARDLCQSFKELQQ